MKALFLDRDGVVIEYIPYLSKPEQVKIPPGAIEGLKWWYDRGYKLVIVTNQSGVSRGYFTYDDVIDIHQRIKKEYGQFGVIFEDILICPHQPADNCHCRKPSPYLIQNYSQQYDIDLSRSYFIGDAPSDIECAINAGCQPVLLLTGRGEETKKILSKYPQPIPVFRSLFDTIQLVSETSKKGLTLG